MSHIVLGICQQERQTDLGQNVDRKSEGKTNLNERTGNVYENKGTLWKYRESPAEPKSGPAGGASCTEGLKKSKQLIPRSGTKSRRNAKWKSFLSFAAFAYFASLRETGLSIMD
jgi:hypothetical protein